MGVCLQPSLVSRVPPCHDGICCVVAAPLAKQPSICDACSAARVERTLLRIKLERALVRDALLPVVRPEPADFRVRPPTLLGGAVVLDYDLGSVRDRLVRGPRNGPRYVSVGYRRPLREERVLAPRVRVQRGRLTLLAASHALKAPHGAHRHLVFFISKMSLTLRASSLKNSRGRRK